MKKIEDLVTIVVLCVVAFGSLSLVSGQGACGIRQTSNESVVDGEQIEPGEWPWHTAIYWWRGSKLNPPDRICEGALIDAEGWVLTAASCLRGADGSLLGKKGLMVHVGLVALQQNTRHSSKFRVDRVVMNDEVDLALVKVQVHENDDWAGMTVCLSDEERDWMKIYGKPVYVLQQSHRHRFGGFQIVQLQLQKEVVCHGLTLSIKSEAVSDNSIKLKTKDTNYRETSRGTALYLKEPEGWTLIGISNKVQSAIPGTLCQPGDYESFLNVNLDPVQQWISEQLNDIDIGSIETSTEY